MKQTLQISLLLFSVLFLSACGFHLRNQNSFPPQLYKLYFTATNPYGQLELQLKQTLQQIGIKFVQHPQLAPVTLNILSSQLTSTKPTIGTSAQASVYTYTLVVKFQLQNKKGKVLTGTESVSVSNTLTLDADQVLGSSNETQGVQRELRRSAINQILDLLSSKQTAIALEKL